MEAFDLSEQDTQDTAIVSIVIILNIDLKNFYIAYLEKNWIIDKEKREIQIVMQEAFERYLDLIQNSVKFK